MEANKTSEDKEKKSNFAIKKRLDELEKELVIRDITDQSEGKRSLLFSIKPSGGSKSEDGGSSLEKLRKYIEQHKTDDPPTLDELM
jgi:hypothetical protein